MLILLDSDGLEVGTLPYEEPPDAIMLEDDMLFEFEAQAGDDYIYRLVKP